ESGAGCGTRERGKRKPRPRAALGKPPRGTKTAGSVRLAVNAKAVMPRGASRDAGARVMCATGPAVRARPADPAGLAKSRPCAFSARRSPRFRGEGKRRAHPAPEPKEGAIAHDLPAGRMNQLNDDRAAAHPPLGGRVDPPERSEAKRGGRGGVK